MKPSRLIVGLLFPLSALAQTVPHGTYLTAPYGAGGTWNLYQTCDIPQTWTFAQNSADAMEDPLGKSGKKGHLVTIGSAAENMFVYNKVLGRAIWIGLTDNEKWGGKEAGTSRTNGWRWVTGEPLTFQNWRSLEPNSFAGGEDGVGLDYGARWADFGIGSQGEEAVRHPYMIEWETNAAAPIPGAAVIGQVLPAKWSRDLTKWDGAVQGEGGWTVFSAVGIGSSSIEGAAAGLQSRLESASNVFRIPRLNYHISREMFFGGGWTSIEDHPPFPMVEGYCGALHVAKVRLEKAGTWSFNVHADDFVAVRVRGLKWKTATGMGGMDPLDHSVIYHACECGDGTVIGVIDLPAGETTVEVMLGNRMYDGMVQLLAAPGDVRLDGGTHQWRYPGHKASGDLAVPGMDAAGWKVTRTNQEPGGAKMRTLMAGLALAEKSTATTVEGVEKINYIDSGAEADIKFPDPVEFPGDEPGGQDQFVIRATGNLVIPRDGVYHIGIHADDHCALRIPGQKWIRLVRDTGYCGKLEGDTMYGEGPMFMGTNTQLLGEIELKKGVYQTEALYLDEDGPSSFAVFGGQADYAPRLLARSGAGMEPDIDGLPLVLPVK